MRSIRAKVVNGRLVVDEPTTLPEGTVLDLVIDDGGDDLGTEARRALDAAIARSAAELRSGKGRTADDVMRDIRRRAGS